MSGGRPEGSLPVRFFPWAASIATTAFATSRARRHPLYRALALFSAGSAAVGLRDVLQAKHSVLRNYPLIGHARYILEDLRPEIQQYFIERNTDGAPFDRETRTLVYQRAKGIHAKEPFGTERDVYAEGYEWLRHSMAVLPLPETLPRVRVGGPDCTQPYDMALLNVSAMSFGSLSANAVEALNRGAAMGGFAHNTGEGGLTEHHLHGGDLVWQLGSGYFGARTLDGDFDPARFRDQAERPAVKAIEFKLSQGAKPGLGGVMPAAKVTPEIAEIRGVPLGKDVLSPPWHTAFSTPLELVEFIARARELARGKPVGIKLCVGYRHEFLAICKAMLELDTTPDFITVDGSEGGTGAAPLEYSDTMGTPLTEGLMTVHNALVGAGLRDRIKVAASGKIASGHAMVARMAIGADYTNAARSMMFALGCIQAQECHTNRCPTGVTTQDPTRARALVVADKSVRVKQFQQATVESAVQIMASMGAAHPDDLHPWMLVRRTATSAVNSYDELYDWLSPGQLLAMPPQGWEADWRRADMTSFAPTRR